MKSRMNREVQVRFCERFGGETPPYLLDFFICLGTRKLSRYTNLFILIVFYFFSCCRNYIVSVRGGKFKNSLAYDLQAHCQSTGLGVGMCGFGNVLAKVEILIKRLLQTFQAVLHLDDSKVIPICSQLQLAIGNYHTCHSIISQH